MHGDLAAQFAQGSLVAAAVQGDQHADTTEARRHRIVDVGGHDAFIDRQAGGAAQLHVLAHRGDQVGDLVLDRRAAFQRGAVQTFERGVLKAQLGERLGGVLEQVIAGHEVGLGVELDGGTDFTGSNFFRGNGDEAFSGDAVSLLGGLGQALGAQPVDRGIDVAVGFLERLLAVHHADAGLGAQFHHEGGGDLGHG